MAVRSVEVAEASSICVSGPDSTSVLRTPQARGDSPNGSKRSPNPQADDPWFRFFFGDRLPERQEPVSSLGSGVIVSSEGYILTNHHVVDGADEIEIALTDGRKGNAKVVGSDPETDLAVLKVTMKDLPAITLGRKDSVE